MHFPCQVRGIILRYDGSASNGEAFLVLFSVLSSFDWKFDSQWEFVVFSRGTFYANADCVWVNLSELIFLLF